MQAGADLGKRIAAVREIEELGSEVMVLRADVAVEKDMREVMDAIDGSFGALNGVIHAAGLPGPESFIGMMELDRAHCERQLRPKVSGLRVLERVLRGRPLDFCLLTSSLSSVLGGLGWTAYSAADGFMGAFAHEQNRVGNVPWITIDWDVWLPANVGDRAGVYLLTMTPEEGLDTFARVIATDSLRHVIVSTVDLQTRAETWTRKSTVRGRSRSEEEGASSLLVGQRLSNRSLVPENEIENTVCRIWQDLLGLKQIGVGDNFFELGGDSLLATQLVARLRETFDVEFPLRGIFEAPTVADLAKLIEARRWMKERAGMTDVTSSGMREEIEL
jgi:acyl carrier protein/NAD(P)-dependent dehydrogenase (short-subunit alcohol dehydrogenase family)